MKNRLLIGAGLFLVAAGFTAVAHEGHKHPDKAKTAGASPTIFRGEILDLSCYLAHEGKGKDHKKCAKACLIEKHVAPGLLTAEGKVYVLVSDHKHEKAFKAVGELAAEKAKVTGLLVTSGGLQAILVEKIEKE